MKPETKFWGRIREYFSGVEYDRIESRTSAGIPDLLFFPGGSQKNIHVELKSANPHPKGIWDFPMRDSQHLWFRKAVREKTPVCLLVELKGFRDILLFIPATVPEVDTLYRLSKRFHIEQTNLLLTKSLLANYSGDHKLLPEMIFNNQIF